MFDVMLIYQLSGGKHPGMPRRFYHRTVKLPFVSEKLDIFVGGQTCPVSRVCCVAGESTIYAVLEPDHGAFKSTADAVVQRHKTLLRMGWTLYSEKAARPFPGEKS